MKTLILPISLIASGSLFAASYTDIGGGSALHTVTGGTFDSITINAPSASDTGYKGNLSTDSNITIESTLGGTFVPLEANQAHINIYSDYEFNTNVLTKYTGTSTADYFNNTVLVHNGATVKFNKGLSTDKGSKPSTRTIFAGEGLAGGDGYTTTSFTRGFIDLTVQSSAKITSQTLIAGATLTLRAAEGVSTATLGYVHLFYDCIIDMQCNVYTEDSLAARSSINTADNMNIGTVYLNGNVLNVASLTLNNSKKDDLRAGITTLDMSATENSTLIIRGSVGLSNYSTKTSRIEFTNTDLNDLILVKNALSDSALDLLYINGKTGDEILTEKYMYEGVEYNRYYVIPEPSTYAMIFGALALGFVAYRRRK